jgi:hypothetical protein
VKNGSAPRAPAPARARLPAREPSRPFRPPIS